MRVLLLLQSTLLCVSASAAMSVTLHSSQQGPHFVGTPFIWTANVRGALPGTIEYQFRGGKGANPLRLLRDFHSSNQVVWVPSEAEGSYNLQVTARNRNTGETAESSVALDVAPIVMGGQPVISATPNPLVALYSAPGCASGSSMFIQFGTDANLTGTNPLPCTPGTSMNFYIGGMLPSTIYNMNYVVQTGSSQIVSPGLSFTTGPIDPSLAFPELLRLQLPNASSSSAQGTLLMDYLSPPAGPYYFPTAVDLEGRVIWYYPVLGVAAQDTTYFIRPIPQSQGHILLLANDPSQYPSKGQLLREIDLAGNTVMETSVNAINVQLAAQGKVAITGFNHDALRLPNGHTLAIASQEQFYPAGTQGSATAVDLLGNAIVDLDQNFQVAWSWSAYDHLDVNRAAVLGETCSGQAGCPDLVLSTLSNDWLHANSIQYLAATGDILMSIRHQDWVVRIDYANGAGSGDVIWRLGLGGDFTIAGTDPYPWFSHQHDAQLNASNNVFSAFDNGNTRIIQNGGVGHSRGYVLQLDEQNRVVTPTLLADLGVYSIAVGSAQLLDNGNYHFEAGFVPTPVVESFAMEIQPNAIQSFTLQGFLQVYRSYRMASLYSMN